jgi:hypothetical protein
MELFNIRRTYINVLKFLGIDPSTAMDDNKIELELKTRNYLSVRTKKDNVEIIVCIVKHDVSIVENGKLIDECTSKLRLKIDLSGNTDVVEKIIKKHKVNIRKLETLLRETYPKFNINVSYLSYNVFKLSLEERLALNIVDYDLLTSEEEIEAMERGHFKKNQTPLLILDNEPILILKHATVGQLVREKLFNRNCGIQVTYKRIA